ncbi:response regulator [Sphingomonas sp.]|uniref:response regulator n=1 Tax=Sphingomonas sp. TaxID=28214 RepID=UPI002DBCCBCE|nr:response regulator [Sphingomonas sp.]HEU4967722.1 response regulator [Sphingomonas sp.]
MQRILIVEDEPLIAFDTEHVLTEGGYQVVGTVDSVEAALEVIASKKLDLALVDLGLTDGGNGVEVAAAARRAGLQVLFVTGRCPKGGESLGIGCLEKPFTPKDLRGAIEAIETLLARGSVKKAPPGLHLYVDNASAA